MSLFEYVGIPAWHSKGYTGKGVCVASLEGVRDVPHLQDVEHPQGQMNSYHGTNVMEVIAQVAPDCRKVSLMSGAQVRDGHVVSSVMLTKSFPWAMSNGVDIITASVGGVRAVEVEEFIRSMKKNNGIIFTTSAGNTGDGSPGGYAESGEWLNIGAAHMLNGSVDRAAYSTIDGVTFLQFSGLMVESRATRIYGTSFSCPMQAAMIALVQQFFLEKAGTKLNQDQMLAFIADNCEPMSAKGTGLGLFILPDPDSIDVEKYTGGLDMAKIIELWVDNITARVDGQPVMLDVPPEIKQGRTLVPLRFIAEAMGAEVSYDPGPKKITIKG